MISVGGIKQIICCHVTTVLKFFTKLYEKGCQYSSITLACSALSSVVTLSGYAPLSEHPLTKHFIKGVYFLKTPKPKYSSIWNEDILLRYWKQTEDNSQLHLLELYKNISTILVLLHGLRINLIATFDINLITMSNDMYFLPIWVSKAWPTRKTKR